MVGVVIATHCKLGEELIRAAEFIVGKAEQIKSVSVDPQKTPPDALRKEIEEAVKAVNTGNGVLILTDMFGGTPSNICLSFLKQGKVEVISGVNLPMVIRILNIRTDFALSELAETVKTYGQNSIAIAGEKLRRK
ncbi:MAG: PTS sugar transporter subunit IIA [Deltaproteobacteria bacterium]|nr:PTS sugar transporter subunit IIA [Deltaproteobacteria bacterium]